MTSKIEWTDESWSPITGCTPISEGCANCYAKRMAQRLKGRFGYPEDDPFRVTFHPDRLKDSLKWKKPRKIFVCSMGDLFHEDVKFEWIDTVFSVFNLLPQHTFIVLTKRPKRMFEWYNQADILGWGSGDYNSNTWLGVTVENQKRADERIPILLQVPASVHFVSLEPCLEYIDLEKYLHCGLGWCVIGAESGPKKRHFNPEWARGIIQQCQKTKTPVFYKQDSTQKMPKVNGTIYDQFPSSTNKTN